jgi:uncharacterized protein
MSPVGDTLRQLLSELPGLELAFLFGSHASGSARPDSDIDLAVLFERPVSADLKQALTEAIAAALGCAVDIVDLYDGPEPITGEVLQGERLLGDDAAYARLLTRHVMNVADFLPLRQRILDERRSAWIR